jgi:all-trans-retinol 13,14-reductase
MEPVGGVYKRSELEGSYDAVVVGSGIGGLAAAASLAKYDSQRALVLERHDVAGGMTHVFRRPGYEWDVGVHYVGQVGHPAFPVRAAFDNLTEGRLRWKRMPDVYDRIVVGSRSYGFPSGQERFRARMKEYFPQEGPAIDGYLAAVKSCIRASGAYFAEKALPATAAWLAGTALRWPYLRFARRTTAQLLGELTRNRELIAVLTGHWGDYGLPPAQSSFAIHATIVDHYLEGAAYPIGGASAILAGVAPLIERAGGRILVGAEVAEILVERGRAAGVRMADGRVVRAKRVISDAGASNTFGRLLPGAPAEARSALDALRGIPASLGHLCLYVGLKRGEGEPEFGSSNLWIHEDADHDAALARFLEDPAAPFPLLFISFPSAKDPAFAERCPGRSTIEIFTPAPYGWFERWADKPWKKRGEDYEELKRGFAGRLLEELFRHVPATRGRVDFAELSTPLSTRHFANYARGEIYGLGATPRRFESRVLTPRTAIKDLYLTGQDVAVPGVTGALFGGILTAAAILGPKVALKATRPYEAG